MSKVILIAAASTYEAGTNYQIMNTYSENFPRYQQCIFRAYDLLRGSADSRVIPLLPLLLIAVRRFTNINLLASSRSNTHDFVYQVLLQVEQEVKTPLTDELSSSVRAVFGHIDLRFDTIRQLIHILDEVPVGELSEAEYVRLMDDAINDCEKFSGQRGESRLVPNSFAQLVSQIYAIPAHAHIFNPGAGSAQLAAYLPTTSHLVLQEYSQEWRILAILRLLAHNFFKSTIMLGSPLEQWSTQQYEYILSTQPLPSVNWRPDIYHHELPSNSSVDIVFVHQVIKHLAPDGHAVIPVFANFLWQSSNAHRRFREILIASGALEAVIEFPAGIIPSSSVRVALLLLRPSRPKYSQVLLLDAELYTQRKGRQITLDTPALLNALAQPANLSTARFMDLADLAKHNYELSARRYLVPQEPNNKQTRLNQVVDPIPMRAERSLPPEGRFIRIRDLKSDNVDFTLTSDDVEVVPLSSRALVPLAEDALLVALQGGVLKPTWYVHQLGQVVYLPPSGVIALRLRRELISIEYLIVELQSELVLQQVRAVSTGAVMPAIRKGDLLQLIIRLPALDEQQDAVERTREQVGKVKKQETEASQATRAIKAEAFAQFASLKHALGQPQQNLASGVAVLESVIRRYAAENRTLSLTSRLNEARDATVQDTIDALKQAVQFIFTTLDRNDHELVLENFPKELVDLPSYLRRLISRTDALHLGFSVSYALDDPNLMAYYHGGDESEEIEIPAVYVRANENLLDRLFDHILNNARRHGFQNTSSSTNRVVFEVEVLASIATDLNGADLCIRVSNNGLPFPLNFDPNSLFRKNESAGETGNTGIGGYEAKEIVSYFDGAIEASTGRHPDFPVEYTITLPIEASEYTNNEGEDV